MAEQIMDEQALNKKLAEWAFGKNKITFGHLGSGKLVIYRHTTYNKLDQEWNIEWVQNFTESLDACFERLWDKTVKHIARTHGAREFRAQSILFQKWQESIGIATYFPKKDYILVKPALALCLAIEKLIDGGK